MTVASGFEREAGEELKELLSGAEVRRLFFKGTLMVRTLQSEEDVIERLKEAKTSYVGRVFPFDTEISISPVVTSINRIQEEIAQLGKLRERDSFIVACRRRGSHNFRSRDVEVVVGSRLEEETGALVDFVRPEKTVVVQIFQNRAFIGVTDTSNLLVKKITKFRKYRKGERPFTRAEFKIREAMMEFGIDVDETHSILDIGAAPGGWTKHLAKSAKKVIAVDPADLHPSVLEYENVTHLRCRAEEIPRDIGPFHLITNDMNISPRESAEIMVVFADLLVDGGGALMTIKFVTRARKRHVEEAIRDLDSAYEWFTVKRLPHNRNETTVYMVKKRR
jgi:23S rRNA (cytidine2498-2'-O)-methyltransferase